MHPSADAAQGTVSVLILRALVAGAAALGMEPAALVAEGGIPPSLLEPRTLGDADARVPARAVLRLWSTLSTRSGREDFGLWLAERLGNAPLTLATWVITSSATFGEGLARAVRFQRLLHDHARSELEVAGSGAVYRHQIGPPPFRAPSAAIEFGFASVIALGRRGTGQPIVPVRTRLQHSAPSNVAAHRRWFGGDIQFAAPVDELHFDRAALELPMAGADPGLREIVEAHARELLARLPAPDAVAARVRGAVCDLLRRGDVSVAQVAARLSISPRTLQRQLAGENTSFSAVVDDVRRELAARYLRDRRVSIQEAALLLGFSDVSAFYRAFQRWTGTTPARFRTLP